MVESHLRSLFKALSWRLLGTFMTMLISFIITQKVSFAIYIGLLEFISKVAFFYFHERIWNAIPFGLRRTQKEMS
jgi:adenylylsulfate kinase